jgi:hypothetical protein
MLSEQVVARLPENLAPAPWTCECESVMWSVRPTRAAAGALPSGIADARPLGVIGGMVSYRDTPVGHYDEVLGAVAFRQGLALRGTVSFMAVDSETSIVGGRANWAMPKTLAQFSGGIGSGQEITARGALESPWSVSATPKAIGPAVPVRSSLVVLQQFADGDVRSSKLTAKGRARPALVTVETDTTSTLGQWMRPGRHLGAIIESMTFTLGEPVPVH